MANPINTFIVYAREDKDIKNRIVSYLNPFRTPFNLVIWHDDNIDPGQFWQQKIKDNLEQTDLFLLLVSIDFMNSDFITKVECKYAIDRYKANKSIVIPVIIKACPWDIDINLDDYSFNLSELQVLPDEAKPIADWNSSDNAYNNIANRIRKVLKDIVDNRKSEQEKNEEREREKEERLRKEKEAQLKIDEERKGIEAAYQNKLKEANEEFDSGKFTEALFLFSQLLNDRPGAESITEKIKECKERISQEAQLKIDEERKGAEAAYQKKLKEANEKFDSGKFTEALVLFSQLLNDMPGAQAERITEKIKECKEKILQEESDWVGALNSADIRLVQEFQKKYPFSKYASEGDSLIRKWQHGKPINFKKIALYVSGGLALLLVLFFIIKPLIRGPETITPDDSQYSRVFHVVDTPAQYPGGGKAWADYMKKNMQFPTDGVDGNMRYHTTSHTTSLQFIVDTSGSLNSIQPVNEEQNAFTNEALRLIMNGGKWIPALKDGRKVKYQVQFDVVMVKRSKSPKEDQVAIQKFTPPKIVKDEEVKSPEVDAADYKSRSSTDAPLKDFEGNVYNTVVIGTQTWMKENLKTTHYRGGGTIPNVTDNAQWSKLSIGAYCNINNDASNSRTKGLLYNWFTLKNPAGLCPSGWHIPTNDDWNKLSIYLGPYTAGGAMKTTTLWGPPNTGATNSSGFTGLPSGNRDPVNGMFGNGNWAFYWSSTDLDTNQGWCWGLNYYLSKLSQLYKVKRSGCSCRCIKD